LLPQAVVLSRTKPEGQPRQVIDAVLRADIAKGPAVIGIELGDQGYVVARVVRRVEREATDPDNERARPYIAQALSAAEAAAYYEALKRRYKVDIKAPVAAADAASAAAK
jgi:peptidyl-prolyl cis-trans isomerase D